MEGLSALFGFGEIGFWIVLALFFIVLAIFSEGNSVKSTLTLICGALFLQFIAKINIVGFVTTTPWWKTGGYAFIYVLIGAGYACLKWWRYVKSQRRIYDDLLRKFSTLEGVQDINHMTVLHKRAWDSYLKKEYKNGNKRFTHYASLQQNMVIPDIRENKEAFIRWMSYWPFSLAWTLLNDPVRRMFEYIYEQLGVRLQQIADQVFSGTEHQFLNAEELAVIAAEEKAKEASDRQNQRGNR